MPKRWRVGGEEPDSYLILSLAIQEEERTLSEITVTEDTTPAGGRMDHETSTVWRHLPVILSIV